MKTTRRGFLGAALAVAAAGCHRTATPPAVEAAGPHRVAAPPERARVVVVRASAFRSLEAAVGTAIERFGGIPGLRRGDTVCLKPALNSDKPYPATADPATAAVLARLALDHGATPFIADRTMFARATAPVLERTGMNALAAKLGIRALALDDEPTVELCDTRATHWGGSVHLYAPPIEATHLINLCTPRTHKLAGFTLALKNNVGLVGGGRRLGMHGPGGFRERVAEINLFTRPSLVVMDGRQGFTDGGPDAGTLRALDFIAVSDDPCAIDAVAMMLLHQAGARLTAATVGEDPILQRAATLGIGIGALGRIDVVTDDEPFLRALAPASAG